MTLSGLSQRCGIAKSTLSQLEAGEGNPTIETVWAIANALNTPFSSLISDGPLASPVEEEGSSVRFIERSGSGADPTIEVYAMKIDAKCLKSSAPHPPGVTEKVIVTRGTMLVGDANHPKLVNAGDVHAFSGDIPHIYASMGEPTEAMVFVQYPGQGATTAKGVVALDWPTSSNWDGVVNVIARLRIEVSNGTAAALVRFRGCELPPDQAQHVILKNVLNDRPDTYGWPILSFTGADHSGPYLAILPSHFTHAFTSAVGRETFDSPVALRALSLARRAEASLQPATDDHDNDLSDQPKTWLIEALSSEVALQRGHLRLPHQLHHLTQRQRRTARPSTDEAFSSRIDVDQYDAFELLHPAYARQVVAMAQDISEFGVNRHSFNNIDVGTGPGIPLLMLHELQPALKTLAVEPDDVAFACLQENTRGHTGISLHQGDFLKLDYESQSDLMTSVGASHHFNTAFMLQKAMQLLRPGGLLSIADEYLPSFSDIEERNSALIRHHSAYILWSIALIEARQPVVLGDEDTQLFLAFKQTLTLAVIDALNGLTSQAVKRCRSLYSELRKSPLDKRPSHAVGAFTRFFWLELQAMVAGFDYEVERKTHARRFAALASATGLELVRHRRVFATTDLDDWSGGTHVFLFRKPMTC